MSKSLKNILFLPAIVDNIGKLRDFKLKRVWTVGSLPILLLMSISCAQQGVRPLDSSSPEMESFQEVSDLYVVDCLLPGEVRRMGRSMYLSPRRPVRTTAIDCRLRAGEYTAYDRADYRSALGAWLEKAEGGDPEAQYMVGEIHEKGMGRPPNFDEASKWYRRAAEQGHIKSQVSLGYFYEQGFGVEQDLLESIEWYRRAAGVDENELVFASAANERIRQARSELEFQLDQVNAEKRALRNQVERLRSDLDRQQDADATARETIETLERMLASVEDRAAETEGRLIRIRGQDDLQRAQVRSDSPGQSERIRPDRLGRIEFGNYYALIVGLESYRYWETLQSPHDDATRLAEILSSRYGFDTTLLLDASGAEILSAVNDLRERVGPDDNVLIYFAGHGQLVQAQSPTQNRGYWLPVNAELERITYWVSNSAINDYLAITDARSVLVIADSCFGGAMSTDPSTIMLGGDTVLSQRLIELGLSRKARYVLSSGGLRPVLDGSQGEHSIFARSLIEALLANEGVLRVQELFGQVAERTVRLASDLGIEQRPELKPIREAGHETGSFFFLPIRRP